MAQLVHNVLGVNLTSLHSQLSNKHNAKNWTWGKNLNLQLSCHCKHVPMSEKNAEKAKKDWAQSKWGRTNDTSGGEQVQDSKGENSKWVLKKWQRGQRGRLILPLWGVSPAPCPPRSGHLPDARHDVSRMMKTLYWHPASASPSSFASCLSRQCLISSLSRSLSIVSPFGISCFPSTKTFHPIPLHPPTFLPLALIYKL